MDEEAWNYGGLMSQFLKYQIMPGCPINNPIKPPHYEGDVGYDLAAAIRDEQMELASHEFTDVPTYVRVELPQGLWGDLRTRSSTFAKRRLLVMPGTIDNGYRGMLSILLFNPNPHPVTIHQGDYLAQIVLQPIVTPGLLRVEEVSVSERGEKGFGSSGGFKVPPPSAPTEEEMMWLGVVECKCSGVPGSKTNTECPIGKRFGQHAVGCLATADGIWSARSSGPLHPPRQRLPWDDTGWNPDTESSI